MTRATSKFSARRWAVWGAVALFWAVAASPAAAAKKWRTYTDCTLIPSGGNDGDSFHVNCGSLKSASARHKLIRLYFVDTPESEDSLPERLEMQRKYWDLPDTKTVVRLGKEAHAFTERVLKNGFTVHSRLADALGRSKMDRDYGMVWVDGQREDLGYLLVRNGLARVGGMNTDLTELEDYKKTQEAWIRRLHMAEADARRERKGCWAFSGSGQGNSPFAGRLPPPGGAPAAPATPAGPGIVRPPAPAPAQPPSLPPPARPGSAPGARPAPQPPAAPPPGGAGGSSSLSTATSARLGALHAVPNVPPQDVVTTRSVTIYDASQPDSRNALGQLRAGMTLHVVQAISPTRVRVRFTLSSGRAIEGAAEMSELGIAP